MAVHAGDQDTEVRATATVNQESLRAPGVSTNTSDTGQTRLRDVLNQFGAGQSLGLDVEKYIEAIRAGFPKDASTSLAGAITVHRLSEPHGAHVVLSGDAAFILMFDALLPHDTQNLTPSSDYGKIAFGALSREFKDVRLQHAIVVQPEDYARAQQMSNYLWVNLAIANNAKGIADYGIDLLRGNNFSIDPNVDAARAFIEQNNPHAVQPRIDIGFVIYLKSARRDGRGGPAIDESTPIAAVGGYSEVWLPESRPFAGGPVKYASTVHITSISASLPIAGIVPFCLAEAADQFIEQHRWLQPFMSFTKGKPNLGNLSMDPADPKKVWFASTPDELYTWKEQNMYPRPFLAVDVAEGQARIPALAVYGDIDYKQAAYDQIISFFGQLPVDRNRAPFTIMAQSINGQYGDPRAANKLTDSREIDYLKLLADGTVDPSARLLLQYNIDPAVRARLLFERTSGTFRPLYRTHLSIIDPTVLAMLASEVRKKVQIEGPAQANRTIATPWLTDMMGLYQNNSFATAAPYQSGTVYGSGIRYF